MRSLNPAVTCKRLKRKQKVPPETALTAKKAWRRFNKKDTRKACYKRQGGLCAYTELSLTAHGLGEHLEHIAPRHSFPERTFESNNIVLSILDEKNAGRLPENQCFAGHYKKSQYSSDWFISPYNTRCERYFSYCSYTGYIFPSIRLTPHQRKKAAYTIDALNLNCQYLIQARLKQLTLFEQIIIEWLTQNPHTKQALQELLNRTIHTLEAKVLFTPDGYLAEFYSAKTQRLNYYRRHFNNSK